MKPHFRWNNLDDLAILSVLAEAYIFKTLKPIGVVYTRGYGVVPDLDELCSIDLSGLY